MCHRKKKRCIEKLKRLGIFEREARIYMALLEKKEFTALEIQKLTDVPRTEVYKIIQRMIRRGLCIEKQTGRKKKYQAVEPESAFDNLIKEYENDLLEKKRLAKDIDRMITPLYNQRIPGMDVLE